MDSPGAGAWHSFPAACRQVVDQDRRLLAQLDLQPPGKTNLCRCQANPLWLLFLTVQLALGGLVDDLLYPLSSIAYQPNAAVDCL